MPDAEIQALGNLSVSVSTGHVISGHSIVISLNSKGSTDGYDADILISSGPAAPAPSPCSQGTYVVLGPESVIEGLTVQMLSINYLPVPGWAEIKVNGTAYMVNVGQTVTTAEGDLTLLALKNLGACFKLPGISPPTVPPTTPPGVGLSAPPALEVCEFPALSWNFIEVMAALAKWIMCTLRNILAQVAWIVVALAALIPQALAAIQSFLSFSWIDELVRRLIAALDLWIDGVINRFLDKLFKEWP